MTVSAALQRFSAMQGAELAAHEAPLGHAAAPSGAAVLKALQHVDVVLAPEHVDIVGQHRASPLNENPHAADDLRLPPPPTTHRNGGTLVQATQRALTQFSSHRTQAVSVQPDALVAEGRMMALLEGIDRLKLQIRERAARETMA